MFLPVGRREPDQRALHLRAQVGRTRPGQVGQGDQALRARRTVGREQVHIVIFIDFSLRLPQGLVPEHALAQGPVEDIPEPAQADSPGGIGVDHIESGDGAAVAGHLSRRVQDDLVRHGHGTEGRPGHIRKISRPYIADADRPAGQVDPADADGRPRRQPEAVRRLLRDLSHDRARKRDLRQLVLPDPQEIQHLPPITSAADIKIDRRAQDRVLSRRMSGQEQGKPALQLDDPGSFPEDLRLVPPDPQELGARPDRVCPDLPGVLLDRPGPEVVRDLLRLRQGPGVTPQDGPPERIVLFIEQEHGLPLGGEADHADIGRPDPGLPDQVPDRVGKSFRIDLRGELCLPRRRCQEGVLPAEGGHRPSLPAVQRGLHSCRADIRCKNKFHMKASCHWRYSIFFVMILH